MISKKQKEEVQAAIIEKGNQIIAKQHQIQIVNEVLLDRDKENAQSNITPAAPTNSREVSVTGKYKYFMGGSQLQDPKDLTSDAIRGLVKNGWVTKDNTTIVDGSGTKEDIAALLEEAETLDVAAVVGLYQELGSFLFPPP